MTGYFLRVLAVQQVPCLFQLLLEAVLVLAIKKCRICRKSNFSHFFYSTFFSKNTVMHCLLVTNTFEIQSRTRSTLSLSQCSQCLSLLRISPYSVRMRTRITPNTNTLRSKSANEKGNSGSYSVAEFSKAY